ncbi:hypothetical protein [Laspinema olomoucense]|nr:hypothetical protein [Laspinema sp. D3a]MCT7991013.1 hypothetical protein [Laspinema sp. D3a]
MAKLYHAIAGLGFYRKVILGNGVTGNNNWSRYPVFAHLPFKLTHRTP